MRKNWRRLLVKLSGESLCGEGSQGIDSEKTRFVAEQIASCVRLGKETAVVVGGGNLLRGKVFSKGSGFSRATSDYMGMLATIINGLALQDVLETMGFETRVMSAIHAHQVAEPFIRRRATRHLEKGRVVILVGGTGNPYFSTDMQAAIRATEVAAEVFLKATKVDGVYSADPKTDPSARRFDSISYDEYLRLGLKVVDPEAVAMCREHGLPVLVFNYSDPDNLTEAASGREIGSVIA